MKHKILSLLALLLTAVTGAWAQTETPLVTIQASENSTFTSGSKTFNDIATVTITGNGYIGGKGWESCMLTVTPADGVTITSVKFYGSVDGAVVEDTSSPFEAENIYDSNVSRDVTKVNGTKAFDYGVMKIEVFGTAGPPLTVEPGEAANTWTFSMPGSDVVLTPIYAPTKVTLAANDVQKGSVEVAGESKVEWTADTWKDWTENTKEYTVDDITMTSSQSAHIRKYTSEDDYNNSLFFFVRKQVNDATVTFSTTGDPFSRIEFTMIGNYSQYNPDIIPNDNWTIEGKSAVWEGEATKSLTLQSCSTNVSKITFYKGAAIPEGVTVNTDGTFTVAQTATVKVKAIPAEGYKLKGWSDAPDCTDLVREITIEPGEEDMNITAIFEEMTYTATFNAANANTIEAGKATVTVGGTDKTGDITEGKLEGVKMGSEVKLKANTGYKFRKVEVKKKAKAPTTITVTWNGADITGTGGGKSFTKDGVTITAGDIEFMDKNFLNGGTFTTTLGNFTKIEVTTDGWYASGTGWSGSTWTGNASSVSFSGEIMGYGGDNLKFVFTIEPTN